MAKAQTFSVSSVAEKARACLKLAMDADGGNRAAAVDDLNFSAGDQWPQAIRMQRELDKRPCLTINKTDTFIRSVVNNMRQQRPRIKVHPVASGSDQQIAEVIEGLIRHIEVSSNAELAYDTASDYQVRMGWGYWRIASRYVDERSFDQDLYIDRIRNPFSVYMDPSSISPDGTDAQWVLITDRIRKDEFERTYPGAKLVDFDGDVGDERAAWSSKEEIMIAEFWRIEEKPEKLLQLSDGSSLFVSEAEGAKDKGDMLQDGRVVIDVRDSVKRVVKWSKVTGTQELDKRDWPGKYIPVVPTYGAELLENGNVIRYGMVRQLKDPQRMYNFWRPLSLDTPIPTPNGWARMGDLHAGNVVFGANGQHCNVLGESPVHIGRDCYRVEFDDGSSVIADGQHPWTVEERGKRTLATWEWSRKDVTTLDLRAGKHFIDVAKPLVQPDSSLPIDPYLLGVWLGGGDSAEPALTQSDADMPVLRANLESLGLTLGNIRKSQGRAGRFAVMGVRSRFTKLGLLGNKHIPGEYLRASESQRWALLQGLMDTDGSCRKGLCSFTNTNPAIAEGFAELVRSLGIKARSIKRTGRIRMWADGRPASEHADAWQFSFTGHDDQPIFRFPRKLSQRSDAAKRQDRRTLRHRIKSVTQVASVPVKCIAVDSADHLFLCGPGMVPTHNTQETEFVALAPKAPWLIAEGQTENHEDEWATANIKNHSTLTYTPVQDDQGNTLPPPQRLQPQSVPAASVNAAMAASEDLKAVAGMFDPSLGAPGNETSGKMVAQRQGQSDLSNYHFYDNLTRSIRATGIILLDLIPHYYNQQRVIRTIGEDGNPESVTINERTADKVLNDLSVGRYDVIMSTGPGYDTKRQESAQMMLDMVRAIPEIGQKADDLIVGQMDWPGAQMLSERLKMANPLAMAQDSIPKDVDPKAKSIIGQLMGKVQQLTQQVQQLSQEKQAKVFGVQEREFAITQREREKQQHETQRLHIKEVGEEERAHLAAATKLHDTNSWVQEEWRESVLEARTDMALRRDLHDNGHN